MSYLNMPSTTTVAQVLIRARVEARLGSSSSELSFLGSDVDSVNYLVATLLNEAIRDVFKDLQFNPGTKTQTVSVQGSLGKIPLPEDLRMYDIWQINLESPIRPNMPLRPISKNDFNRLADSCYWGHDPSWYIVIQDEIIFAPKTTNDFTVVITYRERQPKYTASDIQIPLSDPSSPVVPIPDEIIDILVTRLAFKFSERNNGSDGTSAVSLQNKYTVLLNDLMMDAIYSPDSINNMEFGFEGYPPSRTSSPYRDFTPDTTPYEDTIL